MATAYRQLQQPAKQAEYLEKLAAVKPTDASIQLQLAAIYMSAEARDYQAAVRVLNKATTLDPSNAEAFLQLGSALRGAGDTKAAVLAWNRYLELAPDGNMAATVKEQLALLTTPATTTAGSTQPHRAVPRPPPRPAPRRRRSSDPPLRSCPPGGSTCKLSAVMISSWPGHEPPHQQYNHRPSACHPC